MAFAKNDRHLSRRQKAKQIDWFQYQRKNEMRQMQFRYAKNDHDGNKRTAGHDEHKW
ncbi:MAG: hypothetical protein KGM16_14260 [Bacteroidota bacterium]|nr:hypothetical protein [Bacteroidota bacterium]